MRVQSTLRTSAALLVASASTAVFANKMTPIFGASPVGGATSCTGQSYTDSSLYVAIDPDLFTGADTCPSSSTGTGYAITIVCNGNTVQAQANDKCPGCTADWIDVAPAVWEACGYSIDDTDPKEIAFTLS